MKKGLRGYFITGLLVVVPTYITLYVLLLIAGFMDRIFTVLPGAMQPDNYLPVHVPGLGIFFTIVGIFLVGLLTQNFLGQRVLDLAESLMARVPVVRIVYNSTKQLMETFFKKDGNSMNMKKVVLIEFPKAGVYSVGFLTGKVRGELKDRTGVDNVNIFIPCTPNPTTGYYIVAREKDVIHLDMKVEDAFKLIMTGGLVVPNNDEFKDTLSSDARHAGRHK